MSTGPNAPEWVKIISNDGYEFVMPRAAALINSTLRDMLDMDVGLSESLSNTVNLQYGAAVVQIIVRYLMVSLKVMNAGPNEDVPDFLAQIPEDLAMDVLVAADFLGV